MNECRCGKPTRDDRFVCEDCAGLLSIALGDVAWLEEELETTITRTRGVDYRTKGGSGGSERPSPVHWSAADATRNLRGFLIAWVKFCEEQQIRNSSPIVGVPGGDRPSLTALSRYLLWRVDGLALSERGTAAFAQITAAVGHSGKDRPGPTGLFRYIDVAPDKLYAGKCGYELPDTDTPCPNELYVTVGAKIVRCRLCGTEWDVPERRAWLLAEAEEVLANASEISRAVSWLGEAPLTPDRVRVWANRGRITAKGHDKDNHPLYRIGDAINLLAAGKRRGGAA